MEKYSPKVSIVIPAYNAANFLSQAIDSALKQTYDNIEIIVINDGSDDLGATREVALSYGNKIKYFEKNNGGSSSALNEGIKKMTGEWFSWLSHDDLYCPNKVKRQIEYINSLNIDDKYLYKNVFFSSCELINESNEIIRYASKKENHLSTYIRNCKDNAYLVCEPTRFIFNGNSCLIHKKVFNEIGMFDENLRIVNDADMWFRIYSNYFRIHYIPEVLVQGRVHAKQISTMIGYSYHNSEQDMFWNRSLQWLLDNRCDEYEFFYLFGKNAYLKTRYSEGRRAFKHALELKPSKKRIINTNRYKLYFLSKIRNFLKIIYIKTKI